MRDALIQSAQALASLAPSVATLTDRGDLPDLREPVARGYFRPSEEGPLLDWFARFLTVRAGLWDVIATLAAPFDHDLDRIEKPLHWRAFVVAYSAACLASRLDRFLVETVATESVVQRKLNEGNARRRVPSKQFTATFKSLAHPSNALLMREAKAFARRHARRLRRLRRDDVVGNLAQDLPQLERSLDPSKRGFIRRLLGYREHSLRRRAVSASQQTLFAAFESVGRFVADLRDTRLAKRVDPEIQARLADMLQPGDVLVTRHDLAASNLFLPGYWPHAALYVGTEAERMDLGVEVDDARSARWCEPNRVLEARADGVRFRPLADTLAVDAVAVIRPRVPRRAIAHALSRAARHEGKLYNFDFDFFRADRLVCTEVVYRAYDGVAGIELPLSERAGRPALSAEDLLDAALDGGPEGPVFEPVAIFGAPSCPRDLITGPETEHALAASYRTHDPR